jgi:N-acetylglucosamine-6-phosphate deacetylase
MEGRIFIVNGMIITPTRVIENGCVIINGRKIEHISSFVKSLTKKCLSNQIVDAKGRYVMPGFIDQHIHGFSDYDTIDDNLFALQNISSSLVKFGVTSFCPTTVSTSVANMEKTLTRIADAAAIAEPVGARVLGAHLEGPFINPMARGAHALRYMIEGKAKYLKQFNNAARGQIRLMTIAPELKRSSQLIRLARDLGIVVSIGHTRATFEESEEAIKAGATCGTHILNAMPQLHHRLPGVVGSLLSNEKVSIEIIADGKMVHPAIVKIVARAVGSERLILVTDAMRAAGESSIKDFVLCGRHLLVRNGGCVLSDGRIWGSILTMDKAVRNLRKWVDVSMLDIAQIASRNPARLLGIELSKGTLEVGKDADVLICSKDLRVVTTFVEGKMAYNSSAESR